MATRESILRTDPLRVGLEYGCMVEFNGLFFWLGMLIASLHNVSTSWPCCEDRG